MKKLGEQDRKKNEYFGFRIDPGLVKLLKERARREDRTVGGMLNRILRESLPEQPQAKGGR
jgi:hypothetical protein